MAIYLSTVNGIINYELGSLLETPVRCFFLISDTQLSELEYKIYTNDGNYEVILLKLVSYKNNQYYYSLPWNLISTIELFNVTEPEYTETSCCSDFNVSLDVLYGQSETINQVSATGGPDGTLCWNGFGFFGSPKVYLISLGADYIDGGLTLNTSANINSDQMRYVTETGECYEGILSEPHPYVNTFQRINEEQANDSDSDLFEEFPMSGDEFYLNSEETPTPTQTPTPTETPTPLFVSMSGDIEYESRPSGFFKYTVHNKSSNTTFNDTKYFYEIKKAFDKWDSIILESPYTIIENNESVSWNLSVAVEFDTLENGTLGGAMLTEVLTINENYIFNFGETFPTIGDFVINTEYLDYLYNETDIKGNTQLYSITLHEIGHLLGIGYITFFHQGIVENQPIVSYLDSNENVTKRYYTGTNGLTAYNEYFSNGKNNLIGIPIEDDGGEGTAHVHPEEGLVNYGYGDISVNDRYINNIWHPGLENELMTGWSEDDASMPISKITLALLEDIGFSVDYNKVETFNATPTPNTM